MQRQAREWNLQPSTAARQFNMLTVADLVSHAGCAKQTCGDSVPSAFAPLQNDVLMLR